MALTPELEAYYDEFFVMGESFRRGAIRVDARDKIADPAAVTRGEIIPNEALPFRVVEGAQEVDFVGTTWATMDLVSSRFVECLRSRGFTGWTIYDVNVEGPDGAAIEGYYGLSVVGRCGAIDDSLSPQVLLPPPVPEGRAASGRRGVLFRHGTWDGSDIFVDERRTTIFVTRRVVDAIAEDRLRNVEVRPVRGVERTWNADGSLLL